METNASGSLPGSIGEWHSTIIHGVIASLEHRKNAGPLFKLRSASELDCMVRDASPYRSSTFKGLCNGEGKEGGDAEVKRGVFASFSEPSIN